MGFLAACVSSLEISVLVFCPFVDWVVCFGAVKCHGLFVNFGRLIPCCADLFRCFLPTCGFISFSSVTHLFGRKESFPNL